ncbi:MAG: hypothetical protein AAB427_15605 [Chloroflexota bacterium]
MMARFAGVAGFPLDDAWIHQTYARNLAWHGQWAFILGQPSAGSTSPLWTLLLAVGYALRIDYFVWTTALNAVLLGVTAWLAYRLSGRWWVGALVAVEWHLVWAAASGMETILFCALVMAAWRATIAGAARSYAMLGGVLIGLAVWTRPDGLIALPFCATAIWLASKENTIKRLALFTLGAAAVVAPYFFFNISLSGQWWPNTFFAKQAEYAILLQLPLWRRLAQIFAAPFVGATLLLLPALFNRKWWIQLSWVAAFLAVYAFRLPVTYQHGRYLIPIIPMLIVIGGAGAAGWVQLKANAVWRRVISRAWVIALGGVAAAFWALGANALIADVRVINAEMVRTAKWVAANLPPGTVVAAHDIGALGYFADVQLIDLAGLVSPEVIPIIGDEKRLREFMSREGAQYFINYPGWCPGFTGQADVTPVFQTGPLCDPSAPNLHMTVYRLSGGR